jgi:hypothetical protein
VHSQLQLQPHKLKSQLWVVVVEVVPQILVVLAVAVVVAEQLFM